MYSFKHTHSLSPKLSDGLSYFPLSAPRPSTLQFALSYNVFRTIYTTLASYITWLRRRTFTHIERILQKSYDALDHRAKEYFLDIACFFKGEYEDYVLQIVPKKFIEEFVDKAMITIEGSRILMHELLANMGKDIVHKESPNDPGQRSRLWFYEDVKQVLMKSTGTRNIKGIMVKLPKPAEIILYPECFRNMVNLQIFINHNASLHGDINYLPNTLRFIDWPSCQLQSLPPNFQGNRLVVFNMLGNHIRHLEGFKHLSNPTSMDLSGCQFLEKISDLSGIPNIKYLILSGCRRLVEIDDSVGLLDKLRCFNLTGLELRLLYFWSTLRYRDLSGNNFVTILECISKFVSLDQLDLHDCKSLLEIPQEVLPPRVYAVLPDNCTSLEKIPKLPLSSEVEYLHLINCIRLRGYDITLYSGSGFCLFCNNLFLN
ncbi:hypothetical protein PRUPE_2G068300 [Prunus persica]|uniref:Disease resistance protein Roq1-like winged-helix domain-containing protein n=1 Tax=Prunus persica TaxID=3760 RepID=A0A251QCA2_PRUPE|nr:hypothetical protein PRUPE_2G068300 [Prunus persica]